MVIRGAITVTENNREEISEKTREMLQTIMKENQLDIDDIVCIQFTATKDLDAVYPAVVARDLRITEAALMCMQELYVVGSLEKCIRCGVWCENEKKQKDAVHVYLGGAKVLRPDLGKGGNML